MTQKKSFKDKCNIIKAQRETGSGAFIVSRCWKSTVSATVGSAGEASRVRKYFYLRILFVLTGTNRLPATVSLTIARLWVQSSVFLWTARTEVRQLSFWYWCALSGKKKKTNYLAINYFWETNPTGGVITPCHYSFKWCCNSVGGIWKRH